MKNCGNCERFDRVSNSLGSDVNEVVGINNTCNNWGEKQKISKEKFMAIATEAARLYYDEGYSVEEAIAKAKEIYK